MNATTVTTAQLHTIPIFAGLSDDELEIVATAATPMTAEAGTVVIRQGEHGHGMLVVVSGTVEVTRDGRHLADHGPGGFAGEQAMLTHQVRNATVATKTDAELILIGGPKFAALLGAFPEIAAKMLPAVATRR